MSNPSSENSFIGVATFTDHQGKAIIIAAESAEVLKAYLEANNVQGAPFARKAAIILGPEAPTKHEDQPQS